MDYFPSPALTSAASYLSSASSLRKVDNNTKLELYGLYKYLTVSSAPSGSRPSIFDMTGRAKWDAWQVAGQTHQDRPSDAEKRYLEIAHKLGWEESAVQTSAEPALSNKGKEKATEDDIWDSDSERGSSGGGGGMVVVSSMRAPTPVEDETLHGLALSGDVGKLETFIGSHSALDLNARDEYGYTALHLACDRGNTTTVQLLVRKGADVTIKDADGFTARELAEEAGREDIVKLFSQ